MQVIKDKRLLFQFNKELYHIQPKFITCDKFWDGGIRIDSPLCEKANFYSVAEMMSQTVKELVLSLDEKPLVGQAFCEYERMFAEWSDLEHYELFREISQTFKKDKCYRLVLPGDNDAIDLIIESNFRYFSYISLYLPKSKIILQPSCHTEILIYAESDEHFGGLLEAIIRKYNGIIKLKT